MTRIRFNTRGSSSAFGNFAPGDELTCGEAEARHFVEDAQCASYVDAQPKAPEQTIAAPDAAKSKSKPRVQKTSPEPTPTTTQTDKETAP
jgi:hypothetical protein